MSSRLGLSLQLIPGVILKFYIRVAKGFKLKVRKFRALIPTFGEDAGKTLVGGGPICPFSRIGLTNYCCSPNSEGRFILVYGWREEAEILTILLNLLYMNT